MLYTSAVKLHAVVWVFSLALMLGTIAIAPVQRTQEARVLEAAREMLGGGWQGWMIPHANGIVRLQKPPLAYWMSAASFSLLGVSDWAGRLPMALCGWVTVVLTYHIAVRQFASVRAAIFSAALLLGSFLFYRLARNAETDVVIALTLTLAIAAIWRSFELDRANPSRRLLPISAATFGWFQLSGAALGLAGIAKGPPVGFAFLFFAGLLLITRQWRTALRWITSGAPFIAVLIALPWWIYARRLPQGAIISNELDVLLEGRDHAAPVYQYFPILLKAMLPWTPLAILAIVDPIRTVRRDRTSQRLLMWLVAILLPLCVIANKQDHYLLPLMPPLALITGRWLAERVQSPSRDWRYHATRVIIFASVAALSIGALALPIIARRERGDIIVADLLAAIILLSLCAVAWRVIVRSGFDAGVTAFVIAGAGAMVTLLAWWPSTQTNNPRQIAAQLQELNGQTYCFYGSNFSLPLIFYLNTVVPQAFTPQELSELARRRPNLIVIGQTKSDVSPPPVPEGFEVVREIVTKDQKFEIYRSIQ
ncbi:hypothetical protein BH09PLA1_BH09PLA1_08400 [soil metagenome]